MFSAGKSSVNTLNIKFTFCALSNRWLHASALRSRNAPGSSRARIQGQSRKGRLQSGHIRTAVREAHEMGGDL